jgi:uncharacterized membrane protein
MKQIYSHWAFWVFAAIVFTALGVATGVHMELSNSDWAFWVQAIGSIGAIIASVLLVNQQFRKEQRHSHEAEKTHAINLLSSIQAVLQKGTDAILEANEHCETREKAQPYLHDNFYIDRLRLFEMAIADIPIYQLGGANLQIEILQIRQSVQDTRSALHSIKVNFRNEASWDQPALRRLHDARNLAQESLQRVEAFIRAARVQAA